MAQLNITSAHVYNRTKSHRLSEAERSKALVRGGSPAEIVGPNSVGSMDVCFECCMCLYFRRSIVRRGPTERMCVTECDQLKQ